MANETTETTPSTPVAATGSASIDDRIAAAAEALGELGGEAPTEPAPVSEEPQEEAAEAEEQASEEKPADAEGEKAKKEAKPRNMVRDLAAEWATARRYQQQNAKRAAELEARAQQLEQETAAAKEVALLMQGHPIRAVERLASIAGITPTEYLQRLQHAYINGEQEQPKQDSAIAKELAELRAELHAERNRRVQEEQQRIYAQQVAQITQSETTTLVELAKQYGEHFPALQGLNDKALEGRIADAVQFYVGRGDEVGRFEVLQAVNNVVQDTLDQYGLTDSLKARVATAPAAKAEKRMANQATSRPRNGSGRYIPTNAVAADAGGARRAMTPEERLAAAAKVL